MAFRFLAQTDPEIAAACDAELARQRSTIELIASENFTSPAVLEAAGLTDALSKSLGSRNAYNTARATIAALANCRTVEQVAAARNKPVSHFTAKQVEHEPTESHAG